MPGVEVGSYRRPRSAGGVCVPPHLRALHRSAVGNSAAWRSRPRSASTTPRQLGSLAGGLFGGLANGLAVASPRKPRAEGSGVVPPAMRCRTPWGWRILPLLLALPEDLLARACHSAGARDLSATACACSTLRASMQFIVVRVLRDVYAVDWRRAAALKVPRLRQLHLLERTSTVSAPTMGVFRRPILTKRPPGPAKLCCGAMWAESLVAQDTGSHMPLRVASVACGTDHVVLLDDHGRAWALGNKRSGGIALDEEEELRYPVLVDGLREVRLTKVACGSGHTISMARNGDVFSWGRVLGPGRDGSSQWVLADDSRGLAGEAVDVAAGGAHAAVVSLTGDAYFWGQNHHGQCARDPSRGDEQSCITSPSCASGGLADTVARRVACGQYHSVVLSAEGLVYTFGNGYSGQLGRPINAADTPTWQPTCVSFPFDEAASSSPVVVVVQIASGDAHTLCLTDQGRVYAFGSGDDGQLASGGVRSHRLPILVRTLGGIRELAAGSDWSLFRDRDGKVHLAGRSKDDSGDCRLLRQIVTVR